MKIVVRYHFSSLRLSGIKKLIKPLMRVWGYRHPCTACEVNLKARLLRTIYPKSSMNIPFAAAVPSRNLSHVMCETSGMTVKTAGVSVCAPCHALQAVG